MPDRALAPHSTWDTLARLIEADGEGLALFEPRRGADDEVVDGVWCFVGARAAALFGKAREGFSGRRLRDTLAASQADPILAAGGRILGDGGCATVTIGNGERRLHLRLAGAGETIALTLAPAATRNETGAALEPAAVRRLVHDANNHWTAVSGHLQLLERKLETLPECRPLLARALRAAFRGALQGERVLATLGPWRLIRDEVDLNALIGNWCEAVLAPLLGPDIGLRCSLPDVPVVAVVDRDRLQMALLDLVLDACDHLAGHGTLELTLEPAADTDTVGFSLHARSRGGDAPASAPAPEHAMMGLAGMFALACEGRMTARAPRPGELLFDMVLPIAAPVEGGRRDDAD